MFDRLSKLLAATLLAPSLVALSAGCSSNSITPPADSGAGKGPGDASSPGVDGSTGGPDGAAGQHDSGPTPGEAGSPQPDAGRPPIGTVTFVSGVTVTTLAGAATNGSQDGTGAAAQFDNPTGIAIDAAGNLVVTDYDDSLVRLVSPQGVVKTIASGAGFAHPFVAVVASDGTYYVGTDADSTGTKSATSGTVWRVTPAAGGGVAMPTVVAQGLGRPRGLAPAAGGGLFVADRDQSIVELLSTPIGTPTFLAGVAGTAAFKDGTGAGAEFQMPVGAATLPDGSWVVADSFNNRVRHVTSAGVVTTLAGNGTSALNDGPAASASFSLPSAVAADAAGNVYVSDIANHRIRRIDTAGNVETLAGDGNSAFTDGAGNAAEFYGQEGIAVTPDGKTVYVADGNGGDVSPHSHIRAIAIP